LRRNEIAGSSRQAVGWIDWLRRLAQTEPIQAGPQSAQVAVQTRILIQLRFDLLLLIRRKCAKQKAEQMFA
jgi:hypothetical protein